MKYVTLLLAAALLATAVACKKPTPTPVAVAAATPTPTPAYEPPPPPRAQRKRTLDVPLWTQTIAVMDVKFSKTAPDFKSDRDCVQSITESIESAFVATGRFDMVERSRLDGVKKELMLTSDPLFFDQTQVARMGKFVGARLVILSTANLEVGVFGTRLDVKVKVCDTETGITVQTFDAHSGSMSVSTNSSITSALARIQNEIHESIVRAYPAQAVVVKTNPNGTLWAEAKHQDTFKAGSKVRVLKADEVFNPLKGTTSPFLAEVGRGRVVSVESFGIVASCKVPDIEEGWILEVVP